MAQALSLMGVGSIKHLPPAHQVTLVRHISMQDVHSLNTRGTVEGQAVPGHPGHIDYILEQQHLFYMNYAATKAQVYKAGIHTAYTVIANFWHTGFCGYKVLLTHAVCTVARNIRGIDVQIETASRAANNFTSPRQARAQLFVLMSRYINPRWGVNIHPHLYIPLRIYMIKALSLHTVELQLALETTVPRCHTQVFRYLHHQSNFNRKTYWNHTRCSNRRQRASYNMTWS